MKNSPMNFSSKLKNCKWNIGFPFYFWINKFSQVFAQRLHNFQYTILGIPAVALSPNYIHNFDLD